MVGDVREVIVIGASLETHHDEQAPGCAGTGRAGQGFTREARGNIRMRGQAHRRQAPRC